MQPLSQRDPKWGSQKLGYGNTTIHDYGCTITALAMLLETTPNVVNDKLKVVGGFTGPNQNLLIWSKIKDAFPNAEFEWREYNYEDEADNIKVKDAIEKYGGCLVEVDFDNTPRTDNRHWVLLIGNKRLLDPWTGTERPTSDYTIYTGYSIIKVDRTQGENMADCLLPNTEENRKVWEKLVSNSSKYDEFVKSGFLKPEDVREKISQLEQDLAGRDATLKSLNQTVSDKNDKISVLQGQISSKDERLLELEERVKSLTEQAKKIPDLEKENEYLTQQRANWIKSEQTYNRTIAQLKANNEELRDGAIKSLIIAIFERIKLVFKKG